MQQQQQQHATTRPAQLTTSEQMPCRWLVGLAAACQRLLPLLLLILRWGRMQPATDPLLRQQQQAPVSKRGSSYTEREQLRQVVVLRQLRSNLAAVLQRCSNGRCVSSCLLVSCFLAGSAGAMSASSSRT
jgi:hypothetical protein